MARAILLKKVGVLGLDTAGGDSQEIRVLNRVLRVSAAGVRYEADPRHAEILAALLAPATHPSPPRECVRPLGRQPPAQTPRSSAWAALAAATAPAGAPRRRRSKKGRRRQRRRRSGAPAARDQGAAREEQPGPQLGATRARTSQEREKRRQKETPLSSQEAALFRATAARANYLALDRPDVAFAAKELCRRMSAPRRRDKVVLWRLCRYLLGAPRVVYDFHRLRGGEPLRVYADTDFAGCPPHSPVH